MQIKFSPQRRDTQLSVQVEGSAITVNGQIFDLTNLADGMRVDLSQLGSGLLLAATSDGGLSVLLVLPHQKGAAEIKTFPPAVSVNSGAVTLPGDDGPSEWNGAVEEIAVDFAKAEPINPPEPSPYLPLKPYQFWGAVRATGHEIDLHTWVDTIVDPVQKGIASAMLEFSLEFRRDHPLIEAARIHLGMTETELNDLWLWGLTL